jgi:hypothetical protein
MTLQQAIEVAKKPKFGDQITITAVKLIESAARVKAIRSEIGDKLCTQCDGDGEHACDCGDWHECHECEGCGFDSEHDTPENGDLLDELKGLESFIDAERRNHNVPISKWEQG